jgi:putative hydrolase of the HAD superfamily
MRRITTVLLDVGGVLLLPNSEGMTTAMGLGDNRPSEELLRRAHYAGTAAMDATGKKDWPLYHTVFARTCGIPAEREETVRQEMHELLQSFHWTRVTSDATQGLQQLLAAGLRVGIVSNSEGTVEKVLGQTGVCQVGPGPLIPVECIVDSGVVGFEKPDPRIFRLALDLLGLDAAETVYIGDTARADVDGARRAGIRPFHLDPYGDCPDPAGDHDHLKQFAEIITVLRG